VWVLASDWVSAAEEAAPAGEAEVASTPDLLAGLLTWAFRIVFVAVSVTAVALIIQFMVHIRRTNLLPPALFSQLDNLFGERKYREALHLCGSSESLLGRTVEAGLGRMNFGYLEAEEAMIEVTEEESTKLSQQISYLNLIGSVSPMLGLFGTVLGMYLGFWTIGSASGTGGAATPELLASKIALALETTIWGLFIAIPTLFFFGLLRNRISRLSVDTLAAATNLMSRFSRVTPQVAAQAGAAGAAASAQAKFGAGGGEEAPQGQAQGPGAAGQGTPQTGGQMPPASGQPQPPSPGAESGGAGPAQSGPAQPAG
jgi:biopolymer transport protein ExbB